MSADRAQRRQLGELLVEQGVLTEAQLRLALAEQATSGAPLGEILVRLGLTRGPTIGNALAEQHGGPLRTEYGLALGPAQGVGLPPETLQFNGGLAPGNANVDRPLVPGEPREQDGTIANLRAALDERTQELERVRIELAARDQHGTELATARADLEALRLELTKTRESHAQEFETALEHHRAARARAELELVQRDEVVDALKQELERARGKQDEIGDSEQARRELQLAVQQLEAELETAKAEPARVQLELVQRDELVDALKQELERVRGKQDEVGESEQARRELQLALQQLEAELETAKAEPARVQLELVQRDELVDALKQELEQVRGKQDQTAERELGLQLAVQQFEAELETAKAELARVQLELVQRDELVDALNLELEQVRSEQDQTAERELELQLVRGQLEAELTSVKAELARANQELERRANDPHAADGLSLPKVRREVEPTQGPGEQVVRPGPSMELDRGLELARSETDGDAGVGHQSVRDLELSMRQHKAELEALAAELNRALEDRTHHASRAHDLEEQLQRALTQNDEIAAAEHAQRELVMVARARAQRRYGQPLRAASAAEAGSGGEGGQTEPLGAEPQADASQVNPARGVAAPVWQIALFILLVALALYVLLPISGSLAAAVVVLLGVLAVSRRRFVGRPRQ